jgi:hypothetical protein
MNTSRESEGPEGWTVTEYKSFESDDNDTSDYDTEGDEPILVVKGYNKDKYKKFLFTEELVPE